MKNRYFFCVVQEHIQGGIRTITEVCIFSHFPTPEIVLFKMEIADNGAAVVVCISEMKKSDYDIFVDIFKAEK